MHPQHLLVASVTASPALPPRGHGHPRRVELSSMGPRRRAGCRREEQGRGRRIFAQARPAQGGGRASRLLCGGLELGRRRERATGDGA
nr:hypothetical protein SEVIR_3G205601v2 [Setaria viridis]TKW26674.1 hypothetical protein SEVIR_3G205601v2 [Setaria viridis]TKW26675.1 hypothetical protein SEVIR_3G205601v2 [Setaria viridis]